jgi:hypothetical protein
MFVKVLEMAEQLDDDEYRLRALWGLYGCRNQTGSGRIGLTLAQRFADIASTRPNADDRAIAERLIGTSLHFIGDQNVARRHLEQMLERQPRSSTYRSQTIRFLYDQRVLALATLTQVMWLQRLPERAALHARQAGRGRGHGSPSFAVLRPRRGGRCDRGLHRRSWRAGSLRVTAARRRHSVREPGVAERRPLPSSPAAHQAWRR